MASFEYSPFVNPYAASIGELLLHQHDAAAHAAEAVAAAQGHAAEVTAQAWGGAAQGVGQAVASIPAQLQRQKFDAANLTTATLQANREQRSNDARTAFSQVLKNTPKLSEDGVSVWDVPAITRAMADQGFGPEGADAAAKLTDINNGFRQTRAAQLAVVQKGAQAIAAAGNDPTLADHFLDQLEANQTYPKSQIDGYRDFIHADPENVKKLTAFLMGPQKSEIIPYGGKAINPVTNETVATNPREPEKPTEASLAATIANPATAPGDRDAAQKALDLLRQQKNPPSLEEQYLTAKAKGDTAGAQAILSSIKETAAAKRDPAAAALANELGNLRKEEAQARLDDRDPQSDKNQAKFEQEYRTVLVRGMSNRSGGIGSEDAKVQQANHLLALMDQYFDPKTGEHNIPRVQLNELALGLAKLTAGNSPAGEGLMREFQQRTAKGDVAGALTYLTGQPVPANTQGITNMLRESIERQGTVAQQNREGELAYLRGQAPTDLSETRRQALEKTSLNPLRQSRIIQNAKTGERRQQVSIDGGVTWK